MGILQRTTEILSANLNDFVDGLEQPERMLRHSLREMESLVATTSSAVARSLAAERLLSNARDSQLQQIGTWRTRAKAALDSMGRDSLEQDLAEREAQVAIEEELSRLRQT